MGTFLVYLVIVSYKIGFKQKVNLVFIEEKTLSINVN